MAEGVGLILDETNERFSVWAALGVAEVVAGITLFPTGAAYAMIAIAFVVVGIVTCLWSIAAYLAQRRRQRGCLSAWDWSFIALVGAAVLVAVWLVAHAFCRTSRRKLK